MPDYKNGKVYSIRSYTNPHIVYIGSTTNRLTDRFRQHKNQSKSKPNCLPLYQVVNGNWEDFFIELVEDYPCENKNQLHRREGELIRERSTINKVIAGRTFKEYYEANRERFIQEKAEYREKNREHIRELDRKFREANREKLREKDRLYKVENREKIRERDKKFLEENKERINEKRREKFTCVCGCSINRSSRSKHEKTEKHQQYIANNTN